MSMSEEQMSEEQEKLWRDYIERLRDFRDLFERYIRNGREMFGALQERNEDLKEFMCYLGETTHGLLRAVNQLIEINFRLVDWNQTLHRIIMECMAEEEQERESGNNEEA